MNTINIRKNRKISKKTMEDNSHIQFKNNEQLAR
jgi:hypothetical protein